MEEVEILLAALGAAPAVPPAPNNTYVLQEGDDPFEVAEREMGSVENTPRLLQQNPTSSWTPGTEIEIPKIEEETNAGKLVDLFETIGPVGPNWTARDWAVLDAVREEIKAGQEQVVTVATNSGSPPAPDSNEFTDEELAEAQDILDMLFGMGMPDPGVCYANSSWSPERVGVPGGQPRQRPTGQGEN